MVVVVIVEVVVTEWWVRKPVKWKLYDYFHFPLLLPVNKKETDGSHSIWFGLLWSGCINDRDKTMDRRKQKGISLVMVMVMVEWCLFCDCCEGQGMYPWTNHLLFTFGKDTLESNNFSRMNGRRKWEREWVNGNGIGSEHAVYILFCLYFLP